MKIQFEFFEIVEHPEGIANEFSNKYPTLWEAQMARWNRWDELTRWEEEGGHREGIHKLYIVKWTGRDWEEINGKWTFELNS